MAPEPAREPLPPPAVAERRTELECGTDANLVAHPSHRVGLPNYPAAAIGCWPTVSKLKSIPLPFAFGRADTTSPSGNRPSRKVLSVKMRISIVTKLPPGSLFSSISWKIRSGSLAAEFSGIRPSAGPPSQPWHPVRFEGGGQRAVLKHCAAQAEPRGGVRCKYRRGDGGMGKLEGKVALVTGSGAQYRPCDCAEAGRRRGACRGQRALQSAGG